MLKIVRLGMYGIVLAIALAAAPAMQAQQPNGTPAAPVPAPILTGKTAFISNAGMDAMSVSVFRNAGDPDQPYNEFYAAMKSWGRYKLVANPADADLVFEIRFTAPLTDCGKLTTYDPQLDLTIVDAKTHFTLWSLTEPVNGAMRKETWKKNVTQGTASLINDVKKLSAQPLATPAAN
jgi:hypothetical protein